MDRRSFLKQVSLYTAGICLTPPVFHLVPDALGTELNSPDIWVAKGKNYSLLVDRILDAAGGMKAFVKPSDRVVIKPNIGWDRTVEEGANTHPKVVSRLIEQCLDAGASGVLIFDRTCNEERRCYENSGIRDAVKKIGDRRVRLEYVDERKFIPVRIKNGLKLNEWSFYRDALEADAYINVPVAKHHSSAGLSLGLKNIMGAIGGWRGRLHMGLSEKIADLNHVIKPKLTVVDATRVIIRNGPQGGDLKDVKVLNTVMASRDTVAADAYATTFFGLEPEEIGSTVAAHKMGLGQMNLDLCRIHEMGA
jgi:uncharacterized protein (DUF362 family)